MSSGFKIISVSQLNFYVKSQLDGDPMLQNIFLRGEISNFTNHYRSGHLYMSLKDERAVVKAVMFRGNAQHLKFMPENGMKIIAFGKAALYDRDGQFQFYIEDMQPDGVGALHIAFEQLKTKLAGEGLFDEERKVSLPKYPEKIGVVTSPTGAAIQDILNILSRRWPLAKIILYPVKVQGEKAPAEICEGIKNLDTKKCDVIIAGRGGGSIEDLWAFNDENVVRAIAECKTPIVSAVGHETDYTISDFAADLRAPTPSAAAELVTPDIRNVLGNIEFCRNEIGKKVQYLLSDCEQRLDSALSSPFMQDPQNTLSAYKNKTDTLKNALNQAFKKCIENETNILSNTAEKLDALSPLRVLSRGYTITKSKGKIISGISKLKNGDNIEITFIDGKAECEVKNIKKGPENFNEK